MTGSKRSRRALARGAPVLFAVAPLLGCGDPDTAASSSVAPPDAATDCGPGAMPLASGGCQPAGLPPDMPCKPGEAETMNGCEPAGIAPEACAKGFAPDGERGCKAILPASCPDGQLAIP